MLTLEQLHHYATPDAAKAVKPVYICPVCGKQHPDRTGLAACMQSTQKPILTPGDIVVMDLGYHWTDGSEDWVYDRQGHEFQGRRSYRFWVVITAITQTNSRNNPHLLDYHMRTLAVYNGHKNGYSKTVTLYDQHIPFKRADKAPPQSVVEEAAKHVGLTFGIGSSHGI